MSLVLFAAALLFLSGSIGCASRRPESQAPPQAQGDATAASGGTQGPVANTPASDRGRALYARLCSGCHGPRGAGDGPLSSYLFPAPRDFTRGHFLLVSGLNGAPTDRDLARVLERGMPGSAMPSFAELAGPDRLELARAVRELALAGLALRFESEAIDSSVNVDGKIIALRALTPAAIFEPGAPPAVTPALLAQGAELFAAHCASCHGSDGRGQREPRWNLDGTLNWARDFPAGILKGGSTFEELACRVRIGLPGTAMPGLDLAEADLGALVRYVQTLAPEESASRLVQRPTAIHAQRALDLPEDPAGITWNAADEVRLALAPLVWRDDAITELSVSAVHDDEQLALRLRWPDATPDGPNGELPCDAVAITISPSTEPLPVGMGAPEDTIVIWSWRAAPRPSQGSEPAGAPSDVGSPETARTFEAHSFARLVTGPESNLTAQAQRTADGWAVDFVHPLGSLNAEPGLEIGAPLRVAFACWNGSAGDCAGQKSFTIWHDLVLE